MKNFLTSLAMALSAICAWATDYTDTLTVNISGTTTTQSATISLTQQNDSLYTFMLKNFKLVAGTEQLGVGTIELDSVKGTTADGCTTLETKQTIKIKAGDDPDVPLWIGPNLPDVPIDLIAEQRGDNLYAVIFVDMTNTAIQNKINVVFGSNSGYQLPGSGFETFRTEGSKKVSEPIGWHSFASASGSLAAFVNSMSTPHTWESTLSRPDSKGSHSLLLTASSVFNIVANGTVTSGRMNAGGMSATDTKNNSYINTALTDTDSNGDYFYPTIYGKPDSIVVWLKFKQGTPQSAHPYAAISATITDGTYYQEPNDTIYSNVIASAKNKAIESNDFAWQRVAVPFNYTGTDLAPKTMLVTISTNADAGQGNATDSLYVDDVELVYNCALASASVGGKNVTLSDSIYSYTVEGLNSLTADDITVTATGAGARIEKSVSASGDDLVATVKVRSGDLRDFKTYTFTAKGLATGINNAKTDNADTVEAIYTIDGVRVNSVKAGEPHIVRYKSGKTVKTIK